MYFFKKGDLLMQATFSKRFAAFIVDILIISVVISIINTIIPYSKTYTSLNDELGNIVNEYTEKITDAKEENINNIVNDYLLEIAPISYQMQKEVFVFSIIEIVIYILYYVVFQFFKDGQTIGKKLMKIKVIKENGKLQINDLIYRSFIINSVLSSLIIIILLFTTKNRNYLIASEFVSILFLIILIVSGIMCIVRKDKKTLQDIITKTKVIEVGE